ncbi:DEAD/DEAH box helicase [Campylobacter sp. LR291e]|uniref:DEAD/DEAH box helicase family protein n=1 Tax=Campylobacter sp. LR291e TaxID=2593546 RepID=UPI001239D38E|nr:DEAD/DEAH box helicase family protein [Campylobacter sp. LR291e]KAA6229658.1 DEAD/DEAH box helicase [Campylobacter sp. LR291e]
MNFKERFGTKGLEELEIPKHIKDNLSKDLREYQTNALKYYLTNGESFKKNHLLFNMATGSGKTLIMVALMLDCFKKGYRNFVFFVNSNPIIQKTKDNFCNQISSKYLFKQKIMIDNKIVKINEISNLQESDNSTINIYFTTIQSLHSLYKIPKENSLTFNDLKEFEFVFSGRGTSFKRWDKGCKK